MKLYPYLIPGPKGRGFESHRGPHYVEKGTFVGKRGFGGTKQVFMKWGFEGTKIRPVLVEVRSKEGRTEFGC